MILKPTRKFYSLGSCVNFANGNLVIPTPVSPQSCTVACFFLKTNAPGLSGNTLTCIGGDAIGGPGNSFFGLGEFGAGLTLGVNDLASFPVITTLVQNRWYFAAMVGGVPGNATTGIGYVIDLVTGAVSTATDTGIIGGTPQNFNISNDDEGDGNWQGYIAGTKVWSIGLSRNEILRESTQLTPYRQNNLVSFVRARDPGNVNVDEALPGRLYTKNGTFATAPILPPVSDVQPFQRVVAL